MSSHQHYEDGERTSLVSVVVNALLFIFKIFAGLAGNSQAMTADALDTLGDVATSTGMIVGFRIAKQPPDPEHPYGHGKAESIIAKLLALVLIGIGLKVAFNAGHTLLFHEAYMPGMIALVAAVISIIVKLALFQYTNLTAKKISSTSMTVYSWNIATDALSSFVALIGIAGARLFGVYYLDSIAALILSAFIIRTGLQGFHRAYDELMDGAPSGAVIEGIRRITLMNKSVKSIKDIKVRKMGLDLLVDMTICVDKNITVERGHRITDLVKNDIMNRVTSAKEVFIHVEPFK